MFDNKKNNSLFNSTELVQPHVKMHFTITPIGGKDEHKAWKVTQAELEAQWQVQKAKNEAAKREKAIIMVQEQNSTVTFTREEQREVDRTVALNMAKDKAARTHAFNPTSFEKTFITNLKGVTQNVTLKNKVKALIFKAFFPKQ